MDALSHVGAAPGNGAGSDRGALDRTTAEDYASAYRSLADPTRIMLLNRLARARRPLQVGEIVEMMEVSQSTVSHHLRILREGGFVRGRRVGNASVFEVNPECLARFPATAAVIIDQASAGAAACTACEGQGVVSIGPVGRHDRQERHSLS